MLTTWDSVIAERAEVLARLRHGEPAGGADRAFEQAERVASAVKTDRQRGIVWLRHILDYERVRRVVLMVLGFDGWVLNAADAVIVRQRESLLEYAHRVAAGNDTDVLAAAVAAIEDDMRQGSAGPHGSRAQYESARRMLKSAAAQQAGDPPPVGGVAGDRPTARAVRDALRVLVGATDGAGDAMLLMRQGPGNEPRSVRGRLSQDDTEQLFVALHRLLQIMTELVIDVTGQEDGSTAEERGKVLEFEAKGTNRIRAMETMALTLAQRVRQYIEANRGDEPESGRAH